ncbi:MAG: subfamily B ATP-binding cassette protein MsbA [Candidatus Endobugula sp.]|jgi:subfamily B ATP-binding cassette protein MsbA
MNDAPTVSAVDLYKRLLTYLIPHWAMFAIGVVGYALFAYSNAALASLMGDLTNAVTGQDRDARLIIPLTVIAIFCYRGLGSFIGEYGFSKVAYGIVHELRIALFNKLISMPNQYFDKNSSGQMISKVTFDVMQVTQAVTDALRVTIREGLTVLMLLGYLFWINWKITLIFVAIAPVIIIFAAIIGKRLRKLSGRIQISMGSITHICSEMISNINVVRVFSGEQYEKDRFLKESENNYKQNMKSSITAALGTPVMQLVVAVGIALVMFLALTFLDAETPGEFIVYLTAAGLIPKSVRQLAQVINKIQKGVAAADSIFEQLDADSELDEGDYIAESAKGNIRYSAVNFSYDESNAKAIDNVTLDINAGETVAFVGRSGSGKTTLVNLLPRFYSSFEGDIFLDDKLIQEYQLSSLRKNISFVGQGVTLFNDSIANNIAYGGLANVDRNQIVAAARKAYAMEFIEQLPNGIDTIVGENGARLSGGQRQRLAIARALLKDAPILILDEATSALDNESESKIQVALDEVMKGRTTLVIAHRLTTIEKSDRIVVMDAGKIVEQGSHVELLKKNGFYAQLHSKNFED